MPCKHTTCAHTHAQAQTLPLLPYMDPDRAPLAQAQSIQRWRQRDAFIPVKPCPVSRAMEPCPWPPMPHSLQATHGAGSSSCPHLRWKTLLAPGTKTSGVCVLWPDTSATLPPSSRVCCTTWRKGHRCRSCSHGGCAGQSCKHPAATVQAEGTAVTRAQEQTPPTALGSGCSDRSPAASPDLQVHKDMLRTNSLQDQSTRGCISLSWVGISTASPFPLH